MKILYVNPGFIKIYYENNGSYYGLDYFADIAEKGTTSLTGLSRDDASNTQDGTTPNWYKVSK